MLASEQRLLRLVLGLVLGPLLLGLVYVLGWQACEVHVAAVPLLCLCLRQLALKSTAATLRPPWAPSVQTLGAQRGKAGCTALGRICLPPQAAGRAGHRGA